MAGLSSVFPAGMTMAAMFGVATDLFNIPFVLGFSLLAGGVTVFFTLWYVIQRLSRRRA